MADIPVILITDEPRQPCSDDEDMGNGGDIVASCAPHRRSIDNCTDVEDLDMGDAAGPIAAAAARRTKCPKSKLSRRQAAGKKDGTTCKNFVGKSSICIANNAALDSITDCEMLDTSDEDRPAESRRRSTNAVVCSMAHCDRHDNAYNSASVVSDESDEEAGFKIQYNNESDVSDTEIEYDHDTRRTVRRGKTGRHSQTHKVELLVPAGDEGDATTDVEDIGASGSESSSSSENKAMKVKRPSTLFPHAGTGDMSLLTDVEDFGDVAETPCSYADIRMPSPQREMMVVRDNGTGSPVARSMPMAGPSDAAFLRLDDAYAVNLGHTDVEDLSETEGDMEDERQRAAEVDGKFAADMESCVVSNIESMRPFRKSTMQERLAGGGLEDALTDTEEMCTAFVSVGPQGRQTLGTSACSLRRRKSKSKRDIAHGHQHHQQHNHHQHDHQHKRDADGQRHQHQCSTRRHVLGINDDDKALLTDCEDVEVEEGASLPGYNLFVRTPNSNRAHHLSAMDSAAGRYDAKTDTEYVSGEDDEIDEHDDDGGHRTVDTAAIMCNESFSSTTTSKDMNNALVFRTVSKADHRRQPHERAEQNLTDVEDMHMASDMEDHQQQQRDRRTQHLGAEMLHSLSDRKVSITPVEMQTAMGDLSAEVVDCNRSFFDMSQESEHFKDQCGLQDTVTDSEYLEGGAMRSDGEGAEEALEVGAE